LTLRLYQQADASKRRPVCVFTQYFHGFARSSLVSNSLLGNVSTNPGAKPLWCFFCLWQPDSRESPSRATLGLYKSLELHNPDENWKTKLTLWLCPARQKRDFLSPIFITGRSRPLALGRPDFFWVNDFIGLLHRYGVQRSLFLYSITRETHQRQLTLGLWPARARCEELSVQRKN